MRKLNFNFLNDAVPRCYGLAFLGSISSGLNFKTKVQG